MKRVRGFAVVSHISYALLRPHGSTTYTDAACCYRPSSVVCRSVSLSHYWALQKQQKRSRCGLGWRLVGRRNQEPRTTRGSESPMRKGNFEVETGELL